MDNLAAARACAARHGYAEIHFCAPSRVVSFAARGTRLNYFYTTRTVATCLEHPQQGRTQLFRRSVSHELLDAIFANPRTHTDKGYHSRPPDDAGQGGKRARGADGPPAPSGGAGAAAAAPAAPGAAAPACTEEDALAANIAELEAELAPLRAWHGELRAARLAAEAAEQERLRSEAAERARAEAAAEAERVAAAAAAEAERARVAAAAARAEAARKRGTSAAYSLREPITSFFSDADYASDQCIALGYSSGHGVALRILERGGWAYPAGLPKALHDVFNGRAAHHPRPTYCTIGFSQESEPWWLVLLDNGACKWSVSQDFADDYNGAVEQGKALKFCAFGEPGSYYVQFTDGSFRWRGLSERHTAKITGSAGSPTFLSLGPRNQMFVRYSGRKCGWVDGPKDAMDKVSALMGRGHDVRQVHFGGAEGDEFIVRYS